MLLTAEQDQLEHELRVEQMQTNIEKMRVEMRWEAKKFIVQAVLAAAALLGAGVALGNYLTLHPLFR